MISINFLLTALLLAGFTTALLIIEIRKNQNAKIKELELRITKLERASYKRINHLSLEELENALAELAVLEIEESIKQERIGSIRTHLAKVHTPTKK